VGKKLEKENTCKLLIKKCAVICDQSIYYLRILTYAACQIVTHVLITKIFTVWVT